MKYILTRIVSHNFSTHLRSNHETIILCLEAIKKPQPFRKLRFFVFRYR